MLIWVSIELIEWQKKYNLSYWQYLSCHFKDTDRLCVCILSEWMPEFILSAALNWRACHYIIMEFSRRNHQTYHTLQRHHRVHPAPSLSCKSVSILHGLGAISSMKCVYNMQCIYNSRLNFKLQFSTQRIKTHNYWNSIYVCAPDIIRLTKIKFKLEYIIKVRSIIYYWMHIS